MARHLPRGIKQRHPLGSVAHSATSRVGVQPLTVVAVSSASTGVKISELPAASAASDTDQMEVNQGGVSKRLTLDQVASLVGTELTDDYLPLEGGELTGDLTGTSATFSSLIESREGPVWLESAPYNGYGYSGVRIYGQSDVAGGAITGAARLSDSTAANNAPVGIVGWGFTDTGGLGPGSWGGYFESRKLVGADNAKYAAGVEINITDLTGVLNNVSPSTPFASGTTVALHLASGGDVTDAGAASSALLITENGDGTFDKGIVFSATAFGAAGTVAQAMALGRNQTLSWYNDAGNITSSIYSSVATPAQAVNLGFDDTGAFFQKAGGGPLLAYFQFNNITNLGDLSLTGSDATFVGSLRVFGGADLTTGNSGIELKSETFAAGYGWRILSPSRGGGNSPLVFAGRANTAAWTEFLTLRIDNSTISTLAEITTKSASAVGAGANTQSFIKASSTANLGVYYGSGDPSFSAAKGSLYTKTDATTTTTRLWVNTTGSTTWANFTASA